MGDILPRSYIVTPHNPNGIKGIEATLIKTDGTYFLAQLKQRLVEEEQLVPDSVYGKILDHLYAITKIHHELSLTNIRRNPELIYCMSYQDGIIHAFEKILNGIS